MLLLTRAGFSLGSINVPINLGGESGRSRYTAIVVVYELKKYYVVKFT